MSCLLLLSISRSTGFGQIPTDLEQLQLLENKTLFETYWAQCPHEVKAITKVGQQPEFWRICELEEEYLVLEIDTWHDKIYYQEIYFAKAGILLYAKETEKYIPEDHFTQITWNCEFFLRNGTLASIISLGHGKTEDENWDPESILDLFEKRKKELKTFKK